MICLFCCCIRFFLLSCSQYRVFVTPTIQIQTQSPVHCLLLYGSWLTGVVNLMGFLEFSKIKKRIILFHACLFSLQVSNALFLVLPRWPKDNHKCNYKYSQIVNCLIYCISLWQVEYKFRFDYYCHFTAVWLIF